MHRLISFAALGREPAAKGIRRLHERLDLTYSQLCVLLLIQISPVLM